MTFKEIVKMIHPDLNPNMPDVGSKMADVVKYKHNPTQLFHLAIKWGLVQGRKINTLFFQVGNVVKYETDKRAIIIVKEGNSSGNWIYLVDIVKRSVLKIFIKNTNVSKYQNIEVIGKAKDKDIGIARSIYDNYKKQTILRPNKRYHNGMLTVWAKTLRKYITVSRTTSKRVYYWDSRTGKERYVLMKNVVTI